MASQWKRIRSSEFGAKSARYGLNDTGRGCKLNEGRAIVDVEFAHQVQLVRFDRLHAERQLGRRLPDRAPFGQQFQDLLLPRGQCGRRDIALVRMREGLQVGGSASERAPVLRIAAESAADACYQFRRRAVLEQQ